MYSDTALGLAAAALLALGAATLTPGPASANYSHCYEQPGTQDCQSPNPPAQGGNKGAMHEQYGRTTPHRG